MNPLRWKPIATIGALFRIAGKDFMADNCEQLAAAISYYVLLSLFPMLIFLLSLLGFFLRDPQLQQQLVDAIVRMIPVSRSTEENILIDTIYQISNIKSGALSIIGLLAMAWSGSNMFGIIRHALNIAYEIDTSRPFIKQKVVDLVMVIAVGVFFLLSITGTAVLRAIQKLSTSLPFIHQFTIVQYVIGEKGFVWTITSFAVPFFLSLLAFTLIYSLVPAKRLPFRFAALGAVMASILFDLGKVGFIFYLNNFARYDVVFGSLGAVIAFLFWVYLSALILLFGAEVASALPKMRRQISATVL